MKTTVTAGSVQQSVDLYAVSRDGTAMCDYGSIYDGAEIGVYFCWGRRRRMSQSNSQRRY
jgi:hypothetical protein